MAIHRNTFIKKYVKAINEGNAAIFAGAGLSVPSGYVSWKELLRPFAEEIGLSIEREHDYLATVSIISIKYWTYLTNLKRTHILKFM